MINLTSKKIILQQALWMVLVFFTLTMQGCFAGDDQNGSKLNTERLEQPYPNVWHYISKIDEFPPQLFWETPLNDVAVLKKTYVTRVTGKRIVSVEIRSFFTNKEYPRASEDELKKSGFVELKRKYGRNRFKLSENQFVISKSLSSSKCADTFSTYVEIQDKNKKSLKKFRILYLPRTPKIIDQELCEGGSVYPLKVKSLRFMFTPLKDGTFIASSVKENIAIRFNKDFTSKSTLFNKRFFILPFDINPYSEMSISADGHDRKMDQDVYFNYLDKLKRK